jgi:ABC-2 type transport system ATP-binding protein
MISVENLTKQFNGFTAVDNISFEIKEGQIFGFLGPNGAGKTTTIRMLSTLIKPTSGKIIIDERDAILNADHTRSIIGILTETPGMYEKISAYENLNYFSGFYSLEESKRKSNIERFLKLFDLWDRKDDLVKTFSKGMKQKLALARALIHEPRILFLDEPTAALDPESAYTVRNFVESLKNDSRTTVFLCTHNLEEASNMSDIVCIIKKKIITVSTLEELQAVKSSKKIELVFNGPAEKVENIIAGSSGFSFIKKESKNKIVISANNPDENNPILIRRLLDEGIEIIYFNEIKASLEEIYLDLIKN